MGREFTAVSIFCETVLLTTIPRQSLTEFGYLLIVRAYLSEVSDKNYVINLIKNMMRKIDHDRL